jgi:YtcA family
LFDASTSSRRTRIARGRRWGPAWLAIPSLLPSTGCGVAPSVNILGSFFPAWLFCIAIGMVLTIVSLRVFVALEIAPHLGPTAVVYPCLAGAWIFATWLLVFGG